MTALHHMGITVSDSDSAVAFYAAVTSGTVAGPYVRSGPGVDAVTRYPGAQVVQHFVTPSGGGAVIELLEYRGASGNRIDPDNGNIGASHPAFIIKDIAEVLAEAAALGFHPTSEPQTASSGPIEGYQYVYLIGPDDVRVELLQPPSH